MGFFSKLFRRKKERENIVDDWETLIFDREDVNFKDEEQRMDYVRSCLEQMAEASKETSFLTGEYSRVTSYLTDMEEIEALPEEERKELNGIAGKLVSLERETTKYKNRTNRMNDVDFYRLRKQENDLQEGIEKIKECEDYAAKVKQDLQRLDRERHAYEFMRADLETALNNLRGMALIFLTAFVICIIMLLILQFGFEMNTRTGYLLAGAAVAVAITVVWAKYTESDKELRRVENAANKLISLQNKVKVRYVNNKNLQDYLYIKYNTNSAAALEKLWHQYQEEKEERKEYAEAEAKTEYYQKQLVGKMSNYRVNSPERWIGQPQALIDRREMVEIRHGLIVRRQTLRKQLEYNNNVAETARKEIMDVVGKYPAYAAEIMKMVEHYEKEGY